jgi:hypothetical protein
MPNTGRLVLVVAVIVDSVVSQSPVRTTLPFEISWREEGERGARRGLILPKQK